MKLRTLTVTSTLAISLAFGGLALAQQAKPAGQAKAAPAGGGQTQTSQSNQAAQSDENVQYKAKTVYDFEDDMVEGDLQRPDGELIDSVRKAKHSSLIEIRKDFIPEMLKSLEDV